MRREDFHKIYSSTHVLLFIILIVACFYAKWFFTGRHTSLYRTCPNGQEVLHVRRHGLGEVGHAPKAATWGAVVQQPAHASGGIPLQDVLFCSQVLLQAEEGNIVLSVVTKNTKAGCETTDVAAHLVLVEHVVGQLDNLIHVDDGADGRDVHVGQHGEHQDGLHQQLPVLRLRDTVQDRLHMDGELDLSWCHLKEEFRR